MAGRALLAANPNAQTIVQGTALAHLWHRTHQESAIANMAFLAPIAIMLPFIRSLQNAQTIALGTVYA
jgi:hypothetical protein